MAFIQRSKARWGPALLVLAALLACDAAPVSQFTVNPTSIARKLPTSFFGYAYDWGESFAKVAAVNQWYPMLANLYKQGAGPLVFRIGAESSDHLTAVPAQDFWNGVSKLYKTVPTKFIFCLGLKQNNPGLMVKIIQKVYATIPKSAVIGFELGNEPLEWPGMPGNFWPNGYLSLLKSNTEYIHSHMPGTPMIGMASHTAWIENPIVQNFINQQKAYSLVGMSAHVYAADPAPASETAYAMLNEDHIVPPTAALPYKTAMLQVSKANGLGLRMDELNAHWGNGKWGVDNTFAAAVWTLDMYFTAAGYGVSGVNCFTQPANAFDVFTTNWGSRANAWTVTLTPSPSYYAHWMWQRIMDGTMSLLNIKTTHTTTNIKQYAVVSSTGIVRIVVINKSTTVSSHGDGSIVVGVNGNYVSKTATLNFLKASAFTATTGVTYNGRSADHRLWNYMYGPSPPASTAYVVHGTYANGVTTYYLSLPPYSAIMLAIV